MKTADGLDLCVMANYVIQFRKELDRIACQVFYLALSKINPRLPKSESYDKEFITIRISKDEVFSIFGWEHDIHNMANRIKSLQKIVAKMSSLLLINPNPKPDEFKIINVFSSATFTKKDGLVIEFNYHMTPYLLELSNKAYTQFLFGDICKLNAPNAIRFLEVITMYTHANAGKKHIRTEMKLDEFKKLMHSENSKLKYKYFKRNVITKCVNEINALGTYEITFEEVRESRKVDTLIFYIKMPDTLINKKQISYTQTQKSSSTASIATEPVYTNPMDNIFDSADTALIEKLKGWGFEPKYTKSWLKKDRNRLVWAIACTENADNVENLAAYLNTMLKKDDSYAKYVKEQVVKEEKRKKDIEQQEVIKRQCEESDRKQQERLSDYTKMSTADIEKYIHNLKEQIAYKKSIGGNYEFEERAKNKIRELTIELSKRR